MEQSAEILGESQQLSSPARKQRWPFTFSRAMLATMAIGMVIGAILPFDFYMSLVTDLPLVQAAMVGIMVVVGTGCARRAGLRLEGHGTPQPLLLGVAMAVLVACYVIMLDCFLFRHLLSDNYAQIFAAPLRDRLAYFMLRAFNENILYRLFGFSLLAYGVTLLGARKSISLVLTGFAMLAVQLINIGANLGPVTPERLTATILSYEALRYIVPGVIWAILFWRNGFVVAEIASVGCHLIIQPVFGALL